ncbi:hypothetical protein COV04_01135 [Candidatus Uhrbacteria bacterium CG10_big_fil_rev_8_21_14_0_10_48_11]|uniref:DoxX family protein n=1 Tax=Candidatus Uhrbacteria bacterium CG10_big_fil_rev_8_21_14_0_10_48_11 TaxID=1975037 RepID=A0A2M8LF95_9BACT|nr:MAG: hypothetical protein COV04_01135 [Candidatus Uhrbacteria bacterium CG10_big_fil_rev_8_21_14_0_10_48_11]
MFTLSVYGALALLCLRIALGVIFIVHGKAKWGMWKMQPSEQMPAGMLVKMKILAITETLGGIAVLFGFLTQLAALGLALIMLGAMDFKIRTMKRHFVDSAGGWEFDLILLAASLALVLLGSGAWAIDTLLFL